MTTPESKKSDAEGSEKAPAKKKKKAAAKKATSNIKVIEFEGREIHLVGTAHVSKKSVEQVREVIERIKPDTVCVELDKTRYEALTDDNAWRRLDIFQVIRQQKVLFLMASIVLSAQQKRIGDKLGVKPGAELLEAVNAAEDVGAEVVLADREIQATLKRTWANLSFWNKSKLISGLVASGGGAGEEITEEQIEKLKESDYLSEMMEEFAEAMPQVKEPLIDERDKYLMSMIREAPGKKIVAVVGAGHVSGMLKQLDKKVDREALCVIPPPSKFVAALKWVIPVVILSAFAYGYTKHTGENFNQMLKAWILPNAIFAALFAIIARAKLPTIAVAFVASPITSLNPTIGAGMVAGLVEAYLRKPTVADCETVHEDIASLKGIYKNQFTRVILVVILTSLGSALGAWIGAGWVVSYL